MEYIPLYYANNVRNINTVGDIGVVTLWSPIDVIYNRLDGYGLDLTSNTSRIACIGTLYGNGLQELLCNLAYNPQIAYLVVIGKDLGQSLLSLKNFFTIGTDEVNHLGVNMRKVRGTDKLLNLSIDSNIFKVVVVDLTEVGSGNRVVSTINALPKQSLMITRRMISIEEPEIQRFPSDPRAHVVNGKTPSEAWIRLIRKIVRFGHTVNLKKGARIELQNVKAIVEPINDSLELLESYGVDVTSIDSYRKDILNPSIPEDQSYSYGNRIRSYFGRPTFDWFVSVINKLKWDREARSVYLSLWDSNRDSAPGSSGHPCLVSLYFRVFDNKLTLSAVFRTHNVLDGWLKNVYGLMEVQKYVSDAIKIDCGAISILSMSATVDPSGVGIDRASALANVRLPVEYDDPNGNFVIFADLERNQVVVQHFYMGTMLKEYRGNREDVLSKQLVEDQAVSDIGHAMYLGREIVRCCYQLKK